MHHNIPRCMYIIKFGKNSLKHRQLAVSWFTWFTTDHRLYLKHYVVNIHKATLIIVKTTHLATQNRNDSIYNYCNSPLLFGYSLQTILQSRQSSFPPEVPPKNLSGLQPPIEPVLSQHHTTSNGIEQNNSYSHFI